LGKEGAAASKRPGIILGRVKRLLLGLITVYRYALSPFLRSRCRFYPTCSAYAAEAIDQHGALRGTWLALKRIAKCHPFHDGGIDSVPPAKR
jgi:putative membrane protein insertion efficiency factor